MHSVIFIVFLPLLAAIIAGLGGRVNGQTASKVVTTGALMIGAIVLTHRSRRDTRPQNISKQVARRPQDAVKMLDPGVGEGMKL